jgi:tetratricopeptide (TPR) repeat protein
VVVILFVVASVFFSASQLLGASPVDEALEHAERGYNAFLESDFVTMLIEFQQALEIDPLPLYYRAVDEALVRLTVKGNLILALKKLVDDIEIREASYRQNTIGLAYWYLGYKSMAEKYFRTGAAINPDNAIVWVSLAELLYFGFGDKDGAISAYRSAILASDRNELNRWAKAIAEFSLQRLEAAKND